MLCGGLTSLILAGFKTWSKPVTRRKWPISSPCHEVKLIVDLIYEGGIANMRYSVSNTAEYGDYTRGPRVIDEHVRAEMKKILARLQAGRFAREWVLENTAGQASFKAIAAPRRRASDRGGRREVARDDAVDRATTELVVTAAKTEPPAVHHSAVGPAMVAEL